jgi:hypothetical protein
VGSVPLGCDTGKAINHRLLRPIKYLRRTTSGAAGSSLGTTTKYLRAATGVGLGTTIKYLRHTASATARNGLATSTNYLRGAPGVSLGTTIKYLRRTASATASKDLGTTASYLRRTTSGTAGSSLGNSIITCGAQRVAPRATARRNDQVPATHNERRRGKRPGHHDQVHREQKRGRG